MLERDIAHLRFLQGRTAKGEVLAQDDFEFVLRVENDIQSYQNMICQILMSDRCKNEHC